MKVLQAFSALAFLFFAGCGDSTTSQQKLDNMQKPASQITREDGLAIMIVVDISGSMDSSVPDVSGSAPKLLIAKRNVLQLVQQTQEFAAQHPDRKVLIGIVAFSDSAREIVALGKPDLEAARPLVEALHTEGGTAIGNAMIFAKERLDASKLSKMHIMTVTDGENNGGATPESVAAAFAKMTPPPAMYLIGFDVNASVYNGVKNAGCIVLGATNGTELREKLKGVFDTKILVEKED